MSLGEPVSVAAQHAYLHMRNTSVTGVEHPAMAIQDLVNTVKINGRFLVVATANIAHLEFVLNWHESIRRHLGLERNVLVVALDDELLAAMQEHRIPVLSISQLFNPMQQDQNNLDQSALMAEQKFGSER